VSKPFINLDEVQMEVDEHGPFKSSYGVISDHIGAKKLGYSLAVVPPGGKVCPYHSHHVGEEMFFILEGTGTLRFGAHEYPLRKHDVIACPPGGKEVAHQIINTGTTDLKYFCLGTREPHEVCEYPDSNKVGVYLGDEGKRYFRHLFKIDQAVDYFEGEDN
jgi:uncharacterized cupin superfamily protein